MPSRRCLKLSGPPTKRLRVLHEAGGDLGGGGHERRDLLHVVGDEDQSGSLVDALSPYACHESDTSLARPRYPS